MFTNQSVDLLLLDVAMEGDQMTDSMRMVKLVEAPEDTKCAQYVGRCGVVRLRYDIRAF